MSRVETWRRLSSVGGSSERHVRQTDALSRLVAEPTLWWHWTDEATLILGAGQPCVDVDEAACTAAGIRIVRRSSGGTIVYADPALIGLDVALPPGHYLIGNDVVESYRWLGEAWVQTLDRIGIAGHLVSIEEARAQPRLPHEVESILRMACFGSISPYEVLANGRKLVGMSQIRRGGRALFQSGIYLHFEADTVTKLLQLSDHTSAAQQLDEVATGLDAAAGREVARDEIIEAFSTALHDRLAVGEDAGDWTVEELEYTERR